MKTQLGVMFLNTGINSLLAIFKIVIGFLFNSQLLIADGIHSASDLLTDIFSILGLKFANMPKDDGHPFGHGSLEYASSLTVSMIIFFMIYELIIELIRDWNILATEVSGIVFLISIATFIIKYILSFYVLKKANDFDSHTLRSSGIESRTDAYSTIIVIMALALTYIGINYNINFLIYSEKIATIIVILLLIKAASTIYYESIVGIGGSVASSKINKKYYKIVKNFNKNLEVSEILVLKQGIHYAILIKINFSKDNNLETVYNEIESLRNFLSKDEKIQKINIEFHLI